MMTRATLVQSTGRGDLEPVSGTRVPAMWYWQLLIQVIT